MSLQFQKTKVIFTLFTLFFFFKQICFVKSKSLNSRFVFPTWVQLRNVKIENQKKNFGFWHTHVNIAPGPGVLDTLKKAFLNQNLLVNLS